jgi:anti-sigma B factor antagonist
MAGSGLPLTVQVETRNGVAWLALNGELDVSTVPLVREHLVGIDGDGVETIMLDVRNLTFADSIGLHVFLEARTHAESNGHRLLLVGASRPVRHLFELTSTEYLLDEREAVRVLDQFTRQAGRRPRETEWAAERRG